MDPHLFEVRDWCTLTVLSVAVDHESIFASREGRA
jgi:hypothetical protein